MVAGPGRGALAPTRLPQEADDVAVGIEEADIGYTVVHPVQLAAGFPQKALGPEDGRLGMIGPNETRRNGPIRV